MKEKEYYLKDGLVYHDKILTNKEIVEKLNDLNYHRKRYKKEKKEVLEDLDYALDVIWGYMSYNKLKERGYFE